MYTPFFFANDNNDRARKKETDMSELSPYFLSKFSQKFNSKTPEEFVIVKGDYRFSVLSSRIFRVEKDKKHIFTDEATQTVICRNFAQPKFKVTQSVRRLKISTEDAILLFDLSKGEVESITLKDSRTVSDFKSGNLKGTYRTLDMVNGSVKLGDGLMSKNGVSVIDDSDSVIMCEDGTMKERRKVQKDEYYFAFGNDYRGCLKEFFKLCGAVPLVPRYCLGNWWSRYKDYSQQEYTDLMSNFLEKEIPISVATIDMDWHWVDVIKRFGKENALYRRDGFPFKNVTEIFQSQGWTGYSWNTELFPDYKGLLNWLHENNFKVTVNLHPAQGVRAFEDQYEDFAKFMGIDPKTKQRIPFDITDPKFIEGYFKFLHKPYEQDGVDFWWIDWQQERETKIKGLDPLWALNHYHTLDIASEKKRPLILSRFAEIGSHRYPLGFSGDTVISWKSLDFQPYFTANAANVGYTWWSHDIGGHQLGTRNDELYVRWVQLGEFSPIMRLHSTKDEFMGKEPWKYNFAANSAAVKAMRERHALIPYIYSINRRTHTDGLPLCEPMYYSYPQEKAAYEVPNQFFFGSELMVSPVTKPADKRTFLAPTDVWLPRGRWTDWYTGRIYQGGRFVTMYRDLDALPVLAKEGAIVPMAQNDRNNSCENPEKLTVRIFRGTNAFTLYEDDGETMAFENGAFSETVLSVREAGKDLLFKINAAKGDLSLIPQKRDWKLVFDDITDAKEITLKINGKKKPVSPQQKEGKTIIELFAVASNTDVEIEFKALEARQNRDKKECVVELLSKYQLPTMLKQVALFNFIKDFSRPFPTSDEGLKGPIDEILKNS